MNFTTFDTTKLELKSIFESRRVKFVETNSTISFLFSSEFFPIFSQVEKLQRELKLFEDAGAVPLNYQQMKLPQGLSPSSRDIITALNEYLIDALAVSKNPKFHFSFESKLLFRKLRHNEISIRNWRKE